MCDSLSPNAEARFHPTSVMKQYDESMAAVEREPRDSTDHLHITLTALCMFGGFWSLKGTFGAAESAYPTRFTERAQTKDLAW